MEQTEQAKKLAWFIVRGLETSGVRENSSTWGAVMNKDMLIEANAIGLAIIGAKDVYTAVEISKAVAVEDDTDDLSETSAMQTACEILGINMCQMKRLEAASAIFPAGSIADRLETNALIL